MSKLLPTFQKLRGAYYTPEPIANFLADWAIRTADATVLEPSCGDGSIMASAAQALRRKGASAREVLNQVQGIEIDSNEADKASARLTYGGRAGKRASIHVGDFFTYCKSHLHGKRKFNAVIGNPPFIRYQTFVENQREPAFELMRMAGMKPTRLTNAWVPFIVASAFLLDEQGRMAMIVPAELLQVNYAGELRMFLSKYFHRITLVTFKKLLFEGVQQEVVLLLAERADGERDGIRTVELDNADDLSKLDVTKIRKEIKPLNHDSEKWTQYFLTKGEIELLRILRSHPGVTIAGDVIDVDVGIVTGQNKFFVLTEEQISANGLEKFAMKIVSRSGHLKGLHFSQSDWQANRKNDLPAYLLNLPSMDAANLPKEVQGYIAMGERDNINTGYKCRIRKHWYTVPSTWSPDAFMLRQIHAYPKIIVNRTEATCTDTIHRVKLRNGKSSMTIAASLLNSLTFAFTEVLGRSYGGGVLELEPNEAEEIPLPLEKGGGVDFTKVDDLLKENKIDLILDGNDKILLKDGLGLTNQEIIALTRIWNKLRDRRINRKARASKNRQTVQTG